MASLSTYILLFCSFFLRNNEVQFAGEIQPRGCHYRLEVSPGNRKVVSS